MIKIADTLKPQNLTFPIAETNDIKGSEKIYETVAEMESTDPALIMPGTICYVSSEGVYYRYYDGPRIFTFELYGLDVVSWRTDNDPKSAHLNSTIRVKANDVITFNNPDFRYSIYSRTAGLLRQNIVDSSYTFTRDYNDIMIICQERYYENMKSYLFAAGKSIYISGETGTYKGWIELKFSNVHIGDTAPEYQDSVWIDTASGKYPSIPTTEDIITPLQKDIVNILKIQKKLELLISAGVRAGDATIGNDVNVDIESMTNMTHNKVSYTVQNIAVKTDVLANFQNNRSKLVDGEPVFATDQQTLYIFYNNNLIPVTNNYAAGNILETKTIQPIVNNNPEIVALDTTQEINKHLHIRSCFYNDDLNLDAAATHNYIELYNSSENNLDISNNYILVVNNDEIINVIALSGIIMVKQNYIIRGKRISYESNITINVNNYNIESDFTITNDSTLYLTYSDKFVNKKITGKGKTGYIDKLSVITGYQTIMIDNESVNIVDIIDNNIIDKVLYSSNNFNINNPNCITVIPGYFGTVTFEHGATRCFNWVSVGCYDEYIIIDGYKIKSESHKWVYDNKIMTSHKVTVNDLDSGEHEFYIYRNDNYKSDVYKFYIYSDDELDNSSFTFGLNNNLFNNIADIIKKKKFNDITNSIFNINVSGITENNEITEWKNISMFDIPVIGKNDSIENFNKFYNVEYDEYPISQHIYKFIFGNYYFIIVGNTDIDKEALKTYLSTDENFANMYTILITSTELTMDIFDKVYNIKNSSMMKVTTSLFETEETIKDELIEEKITL